MREKNKIVYILVLALLLVGIAVVFVITGRGEKPEQITEQISEVEEIVVSDTEVPVTDIQESSEPTAEVVIEEESPPALKVGLESTDPATVNLASGQLQLVEAFAFW